MNEIASKEAFDLALNGSETLSEILSDDLAGLGAPELRRIKMPSGGTPMYSIYRTKEDDAPEIVKEIVGVIIWKHPAYAYWHDPFAGAGVSPDCSSTDGVTGQSAAELGGDLRSCIGCPNNQFGSEIRQDGKPGRGKSCKNGHRLYILTEGAMLPCVMTVPPTGLTALRTYLQELSEPRDRSKPMRYWQVVTRIGLKAAKSGDGIAFCLPTFGRGETLSEADAAKVRAYGQSFGASLQSSIKPEEVF